MSTVIQVENVSKTYRLGTIGGKKLQIRAAGQNLSWAIEEIHRDWYDSIANAVSGELTTS